MNFLETRKGMEETKKTSETMLEAMKLYMEDEMNSHDEQYQNDVMQYGRIAIEAQDFHDACGDR